MSQIESTFQNNIFESFILHVSYHTFCQNNRFCKKKVQKGNFRRFFLDLKFAIFPLDNLKNQNLGFACIQGGKILKFYIKKNHKNFHKTLIKAHTYMYMGKKHKKEYFDVMYIVHTHHKKIGMQLGPYSMH